MSLRQFIHIIFCLLLVMSSIVSFARAGCAVHNSTTDIVIDAVMDMPCHHTGKASKSPQNVDLHASCLCCSGAVGAAFVTTVLMTDVLGPDHPLQDLSVPSIQLAHRLLLERPPAV